MLTTLAKLAQEGRWMEIRNREEEILTSLAGESAARAHMLLSKAYEETATCPDDYRSVYRHGQKMLSAAPADSFLHTWALSIVATSAADLGYWYTTNRNARAFLAQVESHPKAASARPWVLFALGRYHHYNQNYPQALACFDEALSAGASGALEERIRLFKVWTLAQSGRPGAAASALPSSVTHVPTGLLDAARAVVMVTLEDWTGAQTAAKEALRQAGAWSIFDTIQTAELYWILKTAAQELRQWDEAALWLVKSAALLSCWNAALVTRLVLTLQGIGGENLHAAVLRGAAHGSAGYRRCSLTGSVG